MSVRAYRLIEVKMEKQSSFNLWQDKKLIDFLQENKGYYEYLSDNGGGEVEVSVGSLEKALKNAKKLKLEDYHIKAIKKDIEFAKKNSDDYVVYKCF